MLLTFSDEETLIRFLARDETDTIYLVLRNFQSIKLWTAIPLRPLTFILGPNSSGKSAVGDALKILQRFISDDSEDDQKYLLRSVPGLDGAVIGISVRISADDIFNTAIEVDTPHFHDWRDHIDPKTSLRCTWVGNFFYPSIRPEAIAIFLQEERVIKLDLLACVEHDEDVLEFRLNELVSLFRCVNGVSAEWLISPFIKKNEAFVLDDDVLWLLSDDIGRVDISVKNGVGFSFRQSSVGSRDALLRTKPLIDAFVLGVPRMIRDSLAGFAYLGPIREIPKKNELTFKFRHQYPESIDRDQKWGSDKEDTLGCWEILAKGVLRSRLDGGDGFRVLDYINSWMSDQSFFSSDTRIDAKISWDVPDKFVSAEGELIVKDVREEYFVTPIVRFSIISGDHETSDFRDVGSGFSQVIPVLSLTMSEMRIVSIEQPELHLHPKLQSRICDVFIDAYRGWLGSREHAVMRSIKQDGKFSYNGDMIMWIRVIETHSEHILLRLLRRVREDHHSKSLDVGDALTSSDISVVYFDPEVGHSWVHQIRIDEYGEFVDRWPKGFFEEREEDLFYESRNRS